MFTQVYMDAIFQPYKYFQFEDPRVGRAESPGIERVQRFPLLPPAVTSFEQRTRRESERGSGERRLRKRERENRG